LPIFIRTDLDPGAIVSAAEGRVMRPANAPLTTNETFGDTRIGHFNVQEVSFEIQSGEMTQHLYSLDEVLQCTVEELDAYLATKEWAAESLGDKRQATLMLLHADGLLTSETSTYVMAPNFVLAIHLASIERIPRRVTDYTPIVCLTHATRDTKSFRDIVKAGAIQRVHEVKSGRTSIYPGVYMTPYMRDYTIFIRHGPSFVFSPSLLDRGDYHINRDESGGIITNQTLSMTSIDWSSFIGKNISLSGGSEVVFHHPVPIDASSHIIGIWVLAKNEEMLRRILTKHKRPDLLELITVMPWPTFTPSLVRELPWTQPVEPLNANFCTTHVRPEGSHHQQIATAAKVMVNCGHTPEQVGHFIDTHCAAAQDCAIKMQLAIQPDATAILEGMRPESPTIYYPPFPEMPLVGVESRFTR